MYIIEVADKPLRWIAAVYQHEEEGKEYLEKLSKENLCEEVCHTIPINQFPVYAIERIAHDDAGNAINHFEFTADEGLKQLIKEQKRNMVEDEYHVYFTIYLFDQDYFQQPANSSLMGALDHEHVDNHFLSREDSGEDMLHNRIARLAGKWNFHGLDQLFEQYMQSGSAEDRELLAYEGYLSLLGEMRYDYACHKLTDTGISLLMPVVEKAELLLEEPLWELKADVLVILLDNAINHYPEKVTAYFEEAENALHHFLKTSPEKAREAHQALAAIHDLMVHAADDDFRKNHWEQAVDHIKTSVNQDPKEADWHFYLTLLYLPSAVSVEDQRKEILYFEELTRSLEKQSPEMPYHFARAYHRLYEHLEWQKVDLSLFPEKEYLYWLDKARLWDGEGLEPIYLTEAGHFFNNEGNRLKRIDLLKAAIGIYEMCYEPSGNNAFEVYYVASALESIAMLYEEKGEMAQAADFMDQASEVYENHLDSIRNNFSTLIHYAEFLERCYHYAGDIQKPSLQQIKELARLAEEEGNGMYSSPMMLLARVALSEQEEETAIFQITKSLILHELCIDNEVKKMREDISASSFEKLRKFLDDTLTFMLEVEENYYLDTQIKWDELKHMSENEVAKAWEERKQEIRNREKIAWDSPPKIDE